MALFFIVFVGLFISQEQRDILLDEIKKLLFIFYQFGQ